jgi:DeoR/GlpR family transcriptional regulator of sugar metabolism
VNTADTYLEERRSEIVKIVNSQGKVSTKELSNLLGLSLVTIRNDINQLAELGVIVKTHGGALSTSKVLNFEVPAAAKSLRNRKEKEGIGSMAASLVNDGDVVILDAGSTTFEVAKNIKAKDVTVITNDIQIAYYLIENTRIKTIVPGGTCAPDVYTLVGTQTSKFIEMLHADKVFLGCDAIDFRFGITNRTLEEVAIKQAMINSSDKVIAVVDSTKHDTYVFVKVCGLADLDVLITDRISDTNRAIASDLGVEVLISGESK